MNSTYAFLHYVDLKYNGVKSDSIGRVYSFLIILGYSHAFCQAFGFLYFIGNENFVYSLFADLPGFDSMAVKLAFASLEVFLLIQHWTATLINTFVWYAALENVTLWNRHVW